MTKQKDKRFYIHDWEVSPSEGVLNRDGESVRLEPKAMEVLVYFASHPNEVISREELEKDVWHGALIGYDAVTNTIIKLRKALQDSAREPRFITTIPKRGYQLIAPITYPEKNDSVRPGITQDGESLPKEKMTQPVVPPRISTVMVALSGVFIFISLWLWLRDTSTLDPANATNKQASARQPSIVVLPFENLSNDPKQNYLADGITDDIITDLSRISNLLVIASNTSIKYKGKQVTPEKVGTDLNVNFVLKGTIRRLGNEVRVNAQLVNTKTGFNTWAQRYDRKLTDVFAVQDEVTQSIVTALAVKVTNQEKRRLSKKATDSLKAYDFFQEGQRLSKIFTKETNEQARIMYRKAIELDPVYGRAYGAQAVTLAFDFQRGWSDTPIETLDRALVLANKGVALDDATPQTYWALGFVHLWRKEYDKAELAATEAINIAPNYADGYSLLALINGYTGHPNKAIELNDKAIRLNPYYSFEYLVSYGVAYYTQGNYKKAITILEQAKSRNENAEQIKIFLAASYVKANQLDEAEWLISEMQIMNPTVNISQIEKTIAFSNPEVRRAFLDDLRKAGLPE